MSYLVVHAKENKLKELLCWISFLWDGFEGRNGWTILIASLVEKGKSTAILLKLTGFLGKKKKLKSCRLSQGRGFHLKVCLPVSQVKLSVKEPHLFCQEWWKFSSQWCWIVFVLQSRGLLLEQPAFCSCHIECCASRRACWWNVPVGNSAPKLLLEDN